MDHTAIEIIFWDEPFVPASWRQAWQPDCTALYRSVITSRRLGSIGYSVAACSSVDKWWLSRHISATHTATAVHILLINVDELTNFNTKLKNVQTVSCAGVQRITLATDKHVEYSQDKKQTSRHCRWQTRMMQCLALTVLYTDVDGQCDKLVTDDDHQFTTQTVHLSWQHLKWSAVTETWLVPIKILMVHVT